MSDGATLELREAAFARAGAPLGPAIELRSDAPRIGLVGNWQPLFQTLLGQAELVAGEALILGCPLERAIERGVLGFGPCDPPLPGSLTVRDYLQHAARLTHGSRSRARSEAERALERYGLSELTGRKLTQLGTVQQRALSIATATVTLPAVVVLENPLRGLDAAEAEYLARLCVEAAAHARLIVSALQPSSPSPERTLLDGCIELFLNDRGGLIAHGTPAQVFTGSDRYSLTVSGPRLAEYERALGAAGCELDTQPRVGRYVVRLPANASTDLLLDSALDFGLVVLDLEPLFA